MTNYATALILLHWLAINCEQTECQLMYLENFNVIYLENFIDLFLFLFIIHILNGQSVQKHRKNWSINRDPRDTLL